MLFVNRFYAPDESATSQMLTDLAPALAKWGLDVTVICSRQLYENAGALLPKEERLNGVNVRRLGGTRFGRSHLFGRAFDYASFYVLAALTMLKSARAGDVVVTKTDPPLLSFLGWLTARWRGATSINWLQDVFPEVATRLEVSPLPPTLERLLCTLRDGSLRAAACNVVLGTRMHEYLAGRGIPRSQLRISENWANEATLKDMPAPQSGLRERLALGERFVVGYSGNLGRAHDVTTLLGCAELMREDRTTVFLMVGGGANMRVLAEAVQARGLGQVQFLPYQPRTMLADSLAAADVHLVTLSPKLEGLIVPSKLYGILAAGRPVVFVGDVRGELAQLIEDERIGVAVASEDAAGLRDALCRLRDDPTERSVMGMRSRALFESRYTLTAAVERWQNLLADLVPSPERSDPERVPAPRQTG